MYLLYVNREISKILPIAYLCVVDEEVHDGLGHAVLDTLPDNVEVGLDQPFDHLAVALLTGVELAAGLDRDLGEKIDRLHRRHHGLHLVLLEQ